MQLHILRHAKTDPLSSSGKDFDRKLLKKGQLQAEEMARYFNENRINPGHIFCSTAVRAKETLTSIQKLHNFYTEIVFVPEFYLCEQGVLLDFLWKQNHGEDILIIGHNDGLSDFASYLVDDFINLKTCEFISVDFKEQNWKETSKGMGVIRHHYHPKIQSF